MIKKSVVNAFLGCGAFLVTLGGFNVYAEAPKSEAESKELFAVLDGNSDGKLTADEVAPEKSRFFKQLIRRGDGNEDGSLTQAEFVAALNEQPAQEVDGSAPRRGKKGGKQGKGKKKNQRPTAEQILEKHDADGDGLLALDEIPEKMRRRIAPIMEELGKEKLGVDDIKQVMKKMKGKGNRGKGPRGKRPEGTEGNEGEMKGPRDGQGRMRRGPRHPEFEGGLLQELDTNDDKQLSPEELKNAAEIFSKLDHNEDGQLDMAELMGRPKHRRGPGMEEGDRRKRGKGKGEFKKRGKQQEDGKGKKRKGKRSKKGSKGEGKERGNRMIERFDKDGDGQISKEEIPERMQKLFSKLDQNEDGFVTKEEFQAAREARGKKGRKGKKGNKPEADKNLGF